MTSLDLGVYGAKRQSWKASNPRELLRRLIDQNKNTNEDDLCCMFVEAVLEPEAMDTLRVIIEYYFDNNHRSLTRSMDMDSRERSASSQKRRVGKAKEVIARHIETKAQQILLEIILPNGMMLRDTTFAECAKLGPKMGLWLTKLATKGKPRQRVGDVLSEEQVRALYIG